MPTPTNYNNIAYARQYKLINSVTESDSFVGDTSNKGSIDLPAFQPMLCDNAEDKTLPSPCVPLAVGQYDCGDNDK